MIPIMLGVLFIVFTISYLTPGDPVMMILGQNYTPEAYAATAAEFGLDKPFLVQFFNYLKGIVTELNLGKSFLENMPVADEILYRLPITIRIGLLGVLLTVAVGIPIGLVSALKQYSAIDYAATTLALLCAAIPSFCVALFSILLFAVNLKWLPITGISNWKSWILPVLANSLSGVAVVMRMSRTSVLEVVRMDYVRTARAKGIKESTIIRRHILKNSLIPIITVVGVQMTLIMSGSVLVETIFAIPGIGSYLMKGIIGRDYMIVNGCVLVLSISICVMNLLTDLAYAFVDPRIKAQYKSGKKRRKIAIYETESEAEAT